MLKNILEMIKKLYLNFLNSINGLKVACKEHSFIIEIIGGIILIPYLIYIELNFLFKILVVITYFALLAFEIVNTAIEILCDKITKEIDSDIKRIKDLSSSSVFIVLILLITLIVLTFFPSLIK